MTDTAAPAVEPSTTEAEPAAPVAPPKDDAKAALNEALKKAGVKLKAKDREYVPRDIDDLTSKANRVFGLESELERLKTEKTEAAQVKAWRQAVEADDEEAASAAFEALSPKAQQNAAKWLSRKAERYEQERQLSPEVLEARRRAEALEREVQSYKSKEREAAEQKLREENARTYREQAEMVLKASNNVMQALKVDDARAPQAKAALAPVMARHLRVAMLAEQETGVPVDPAEIVENVRRDIAQSFSSVASGMDADALYDTMGEDVAKRLLAVHLKRVKGIKPAQPGTPTQKAETKKDPRLGTPAFFR